MKTTIKIGSFVTAIALLATIIIALLAPAYFPEGAEIPIHWGPSGAADQFAPASEAQLYLWILPAALLFTGLLLTVAPAVEPLRANLEHGRKAYLAIWIAVSILLVCIQAGIAAGMIGWVGEGPEMVRFVIAASAAIFIVMGNYLPKTRQSFFLGIRTPWTLTSETSWEKTHKLGGRLFMIAGAIGLITAFIAKGITLAIILPTMTIITVLYLVAYSYFAWKHADDKTITPDYIV